MNLQVQCRTFLLDLIRNARRRACHKAGGTAAHAYIKGVYSRLIAKEMNLEQMRVALRDSGFLRNVHQITFDLEEQYGFEGYAVKHQAPRLPTLHELAQAEDSKVAKTKRIVLESVEVTRFHPLLRRVQGAAERRA